MVSFYLYITMIDVMIFSIDLVVFLFASEAG